MSQARSAPHVTLDGARFLFDGRPTNPGSSCEGLLMNCRMVQATFDDLNPETHSRWKYPDGMPFDAEENTRRFCAMVPTYAECGLNAVTINLQGGSPQGYSKHQPWHNSAYTADGSLRTEYLRRTSMVLDECGKHGIAVILGLFYFGQDERLADEEAVCRAVDGVVDWLLQRGDPHVLIEIANESDIDDCGFPGNFGYEHLILRANPRGHELIKRVQQRSQGKLLCSTSYRGGGRLTPNVAEAADFILLHGNAVDDPEELRKLIHDARKCEGYHGQPIVINEDDHFDFDKPNSNMQTAIDEGVGWGYFDYRMDGEGYEAGYQSVPTDWSADHERKRGFFEKLRAVTGQGAGR
ncbi:MAG: hypothetical protein AAGD32_08355 [Planctomycetota bacterium]